MNSSLFLYNSILCSTSLILFLPSVFNFYHRYSILQRLVVTLLGDAKVAKVNSNVVTRMRKRFGYQVVQAVNESNSQLAADVYAYTLNLPQTSTEIFWGKIPVTCWIVSSSITLIWWYATRTSKRICWKCWGEMKLNVVAHFIKR